MLFRRRDELGKLPLIFGAVLVALSIMVLLGWYIHSELLIKLFPGMVTMKANTAFGMGLAGLCLVFCKVPITSRWANPVAYFLATALVFLGAISLSEYFCTWKPGLDEFLIRDTIPSVATSAPGQMAPLTALCFMLAGVAFITVNRNKGRPVRSPTVSALGGCILLVGVVGTLGQISNAFHFQFWNYSGLAMHTAIGFIFIGLGLLSTDIGRFEWQIDPFTRIGYGTAVVTLLFVTGISWNNTDDLVRAAGSLSQAKEALNIIQNFRFQIAYLSSQSDINNGSTLAPFSNSDMATLDKLIENDPGQQIYYNDLKPMIDQYLVNGAVPKEIDPSLAKRMDNILNTMQAAQIVKIDSEQKRLKSSSTTTFLLLPLGVFLCITALSISFFYLNERVLQQKLAEEKLTESENQFRTMANAIPQLAWIAGPDGHIFWYNERWFEYTGTNLEEMGGWGWQKVHAPENLDGVMVQWKEALATGNPCEMEFPLRGVDGEYRWFLTRILPNRNAKGEIVRWFGTNTDVTEQRKSAEEIRMLNESLEKRVRDRTSDLEVANKELEAFSYSVSHDLRAPIRTIVGFSQAVLEDYGADLPDEGKHFLKKIQDGGARMTRLIDDLLVFSKAGRQKLTSGSIDTSRLIKHVIEEVDAKKLNARAQITVLDLAPCEGDSALITQVWVNLITNALKYSSKKEQPIIEIGSKDRVYFIRDNGAGFDMRYAESLFGVFQRLHRQDEFDGTGVGLAIVQRIIHRHQGRIWAEAAVEKGATFYFTLNESAPLEPTTPA